MNVGDLEKHLIRMGLAQPSELEECRVRLRTAQPDADQMLQELERQQVLTPFKIGRIKKGLIEGLVLGGCKLLYRNASGSFARVYRAERLEAGETVGVKILRERWASDPQTVSLFRREADLGRKLKHPNIVPIHEVGNEGKFHFFTMDFIVGGDMRDFIKIRKQLAPGEATRYVIDMTEALEYTLRLGYTHRDLKMTNVLMSHHGQALLIDFGLAGDDNTLNRVGGDAVQRALEYATLEKGTGAPREDPRTDLYFLGAIYYELLTGSPAYPRTRDRDERSQLSRYRNVRPVRQVSPNIPAEVADIVDRLLQVEPSARYQTPTEVLTDLRRVESTDAEQNGAQADDIEMSNDNGNDDSDQASMPTVLCIEVRPKQQNVLRNYLSKRGFRVLMLADPERGLDRLKTNPPECIILMGGTVGDQVVDLFRRAVVLNEKNGGVCIAVLSDEQAQLRDQLEQSITARVLTQPITLRELRREIHLAFQRKQSAGSSFEIPTYKPA
jgi:serine/threonine protein kinase